MLETQEFERRNQPTAIHPFRRHLNQFSFHKIDKTEWRYSTGVHRCKSLRRHVWSLFCPDEHQWGSCRPGWFHNRHHRVLQHDRIALLSAIQPWASFQYYLHKTARFCNGWHRHHFGRFCWRWWEVWLYCWHIKFWEKEPNHLEEFCLDSKPITWRRVNIWFHSSIINWLWDKCQIGWNDCFCCNQIGRQSELQCWKPCWMEEWME